MTPMIPESFWKLLRGRERPEALRYRFPLLPGLLVLEVGEIDVVRLALVAEGHAGERGLKLTRRPRLHLMLRPARGLPPGEGRPALPFVLSFDVWKVERRGSA